MKTVEMLGWWLVVVGAVNWGLVGLGMLMGGTGYNLVNMLFGSVPMLEAVVYLLVGVFGAKMLVNKLSNA